MKLETKFVGIKTINNINWLYAELQDNNSIEEINKILKSDKVKVVKLENVKVKRSLTSNSYCWILLNKMAIKVKSTDEEVYMQMLERYGPKDYIAAPSESIEILKRAYKIVIPIKECTINELKATTFKLIRGSSTFCQVKMNRFIEGIVEEAKLLGVEVLPPDEIKRLINMMGD